MRQYNWLSKFSVSCLFIFLLVACASGRYESPRGVSSATTSVAGVKSSVAQHKPLPWEVWPRGQDLQGESLRSPLILQGDDLLDQNVRARALESYYRAQSAPLSPTEQSALVLRIASTELALDQASKSLNTLSAYFRTSGKSVDDVAPQFGLVFGYAYGRSGDVEQTLAWFGRVLREQSASSLLKPAAERGIRLMLRTVANERLDALTELWSTEGSIRALIGEERARRAAGGTPESAAMDIWADDSALGMTMSPPEAHASVVVGALLPLSGKVASLGRSTQQGMELALEGQKTLAPDVPPLVRLAVRDSGTEVAQVSAETRALVASDGARVLVGPLIAEQANIASQVARQVGTPLLALSKNSNLGVGNGIFRLGATVESQVYSLVETCEMTLGLRRFALVTPADASGFEFAEHFKNELRQRGLSVVFEGSYPRGSSESFVELAKGIEEARAEAVFFPDSLTLASRFFGAFAPRFRDTVRPLGVGNWDSPQLAQSSTVMRGAVFVSPFFSASQRPAVVSFVQNYRARYNQVPDFLAAQGFDALTLVQEIIRRQQIDQVSWNTAAQQIEVYEGLTGKIALRADGEFDRLFTVVELHNGIPRELMRVATPTYVASGNEPATIAAPSLELSR
jgi:branched-chain amino acid transport system substrate-binding protein